MVKLLTFILFSVLPGLHAILTVRGDTGVDISEDLSTMLGSISAIITSSAFLILYKKWQLFFRDVEGLSSFGTPLGFRELQTKLNNYSIFLGSYSTIATIFYGVISAKETSYCERLNEEHGLNEICGTFSPIVLPFDGNPDYVRIPIFGLQAILAGITLTSGFIICYLPCEGVETISAHISALKERFRKVFDATEERERKNRLRYCVHYHVTILNLCQRLSVLVKYTSGNLCLTCGLVFGCIGNLILKTKPFSGATYLCGYMLALFLICHGGQRLIDETLSINDAVYDSKWYEGSPEMMKDIMFILARTQRPIEMNALPLGVMNYSLFVMIIKTSYSYFTLLSQNT